MAVPVVLACFALSGLAGLMEQVVWTRWLGLALGNFATAAATVVAVFMLGLAAGARVGGRAANRRTPAAALALYGRLETTLAAYAACSPLLFAAASRAFAALGTASPEGPVQALASAVLLLPPTIMMGATLPVLARALDAPAGARLGALYAANTLGAAAGPLIAAFVLIPAVGLTRTVWTAAALNATAAVAAFCLARAHPGGAVAPAAPEPPRLGADAAPLLIAAVSGFAALGFEVGLIRLLVLTVAGNSVYALGVVLAAFLAALAVGPAVLTRWPPRTPRAAYAAAAAALALPWGWTLLLPFADRIPLLLFPFWRDAPPFAATAAVAFGASTILVLPVAAGFGLALPALGGALAAPGPAALGRLFAANTLGAAAGALATAFGLLPGLGLAGALAALGGLALVAGAGSLAVAFPARRRLVAAVALPALVLPFLLPRPDDRILGAGMPFRAHRFAAPGLHLPPDQIARGLGEIVFQHDGPGGRTAVRARGADLTLVVNGKPDASSGGIDPFTMMLSAHLPFLAHRGPASALLVGLGGGFTVASMLTYPVHDVTCVELEPAVRDAARLFSDRLLGWAADPRLTVVLADGRHWLARTPRTFDVIVSEPSNLFVAGTVSLYTAEYFRLVRARLAPGGVFCQWMHYYGGSLEDCRTVIRTVRSAFPAVAMWIHAGGDFFLLASEAPLAVDLAAIRARLARPAVAIDLLRIGLATPAAIAAHYLAGGAALDRFAGPGPVCTDDRPILEFTTPRASDDPGLTDRNRAALYAWQPLEPVPLARPRAADRMAIGQEALAGREFHRAIAEFDDAARLEPGRAAAWWQAARLRHWLQDDGAALATVAAGLARDPGNAVLLALRREIRAAVTPPSTGLPRSSSPP